MGDEDARLFRRDRREAGAKHVHLVMVDPPILDRQRPRRVEAQYRDRVILEKRAEVIADITLVPAQRRSEAARKNIERKAVIPRTDRSETRRVGEEGVT